jgi:hypothetical protein
MRSRVASIRNLCFGLMLLACLGWLASASAHAWNESEHEREHEHEGDRDSEREHEGSAPRLILPGAHAVQPGQWIDLTWTEADDIEELEILLSTDGGRTYAVCVSPQLDPQARHFR